MSRENYQRWAQDNARPGCALILLAGFTGLLYPLLEMLL